MKRWIYITLALLPLICVAQQYPYWTQTRSNYFLVNPAVSGTRKTLDVRANYRYQWAGFEDAPKTMSFGAHSRLLNGKLGAGLFVFQDKLGPQKITTAGAACAYHLKLEDAEISFGLNGSYNSNALDASKITYLNSHDQLIYNAVNYNKSSIFNMAAGFMIYNEKFYVGLSMNNMTQMSYKFRENKKSKSHTNLTTVPHFAIGVGYNWAENSDFIWENSLMANFVQATPLLLDYNFKLHIKNSVYFGAGIRLKTCIYGQIGYTFKGIGQIGYSYDFNTNALMKTNAGSHELKLVYVLDTSTHNHHQGGKGFQKQKFQYLL